MPAADGVLQLHVVRFSHLKARRELRCPKDQALDESLLQTAPRPEQILIEGSRRGPDLHEPEHCWGQEQVSFDTLLLQHSSFDPEDLYSLVLRVA